MVTLCFYEQNKTKKNENLSIFCVLERQYSCFRVMDKLLKDKYGGFHK